MVHVNFSRWSFILFIIPVLLLWSGNVRAENSVSKSRGQTIYAPVYSHIYIGDKERPFNLTTTLSIRNTDMKDSIIITAVDYFDSNGKLLTSYIQKSLKLEALGTTRFIVNASDTSGGSGANFIVRWESATEATPPIVESIMIGTQSQQGISFTSRGQVIEER